MNATSWSWHRSLPSAKGRTATCPCVTVEAHLDHLLDLNRLHRSLATAFVEVVRECCAKRFAMVICSCVALIGFYCTVLYCSAGRYKAVQSGSTA